MTMTQAGTTGIRPVELVPHAMSVTVEDGILTPFFSCDAPADADCHWFYDCDCDGDRPWVETGHDANGRYHDVETDDELGTYRSRHYLMRSPECGVVLLLSESTSPLDGATFALGRFRVVPAAQEGCVEVLGFDWFTMADAIEKGLRESIKIPGLPAEFYREATTAIGARLRVGLEWA